MGLVRYISDTKAEMKHVSWPTKKQTASFTVVVIALSLVTAFFLGFFDFAFTWLLETFII